MASVPGGPTKRLLHELAALRKARDAPDELVRELGPVHDDDLMTWRAELVAPPEGVYGGGVFTLSIAIPPTYPTKPPTIRFVTPIFHPNVHWKTGEICLDVLQAQWSPAWTLRSACTAILALMDVPEPDSPLNVDAANLVRCGDVVAYRSLCQMYTALWAEKAPGH